MKLTYEVKKPVVSHWERAIAALWNYGIPIIFIYQAGRQTSIITYLYFVIGIAPLFVRFKL